jgi:hypothetical protein
LSSYSSSYSSSSLLDNRNTSTILLATDSENADDAIKKKETRKKGTRKGKHASSTENRRLVWERIVWPLILQVNREYFTFEEYRTKRDKFCSIYTNVSPFRLSRGLTSLTERAILIKKSRTSNLYSIHYRLVPYMRKGLNLEYRLAVKKTYAKA